MAGILTVSEFLGGPDNIITEHCFPSDQWSLISTVTNDDDTAKDITGWTLAADYQTLVVDEIAFSRSGQPNFTNSTVIGSFDKVEVQTPYNPTIIDAAGGTFKVHFPANMYSYEIIPDARKNVPMVIYSLTLTDNSTPAQIKSQRWCLIQNYEPDAPIGDPTLNVNYNAIVSGA